ncbi:MAG TPA: hypothetical protein VFB25_01935 [Gaiellaceae bacterium]|nr:hypothetical protein [Gaiellaceae bacterium]
MAEPERGFTDAQRGSIGVCVSQLEELVDTLRRLGVQSSWLDEIASAVCDLEHATDARRPAPPKNAAKAAVSQMRVLEEELRPPRMRAYGDLSEASAQLLDRHIQRLATLTSLLDSEIERARGNDQAS